MRSVKDLYRKIMKICLILAGVFSFLFLINLFYLVINGSLDISGNSFIISENQPIARFNFWFGASVVIALLLVARIMHDLIEKKGKLVDAESYKRAQRAKKAQIDGKTDFVKKSEEIDKIKDQTTILAKHKRQKEELKAIKEAEKIDKAAQKEAQRIAKEAEKAELERIKEEEQLARNAEKIEQARIREEERIAKAAEQARLKEEQQLEKELELAEKARLKVEKLQAVTEPQEVEEEPVLIEKIVEEAPQESEPEPVIEPVQEVETAPIQPAFITVKKQVAKKAKVVTKTKTDIIAIINEETDVSKNKANKFLKGFAQVIKETLIVRDEVVLNELGTFTTIEMPAKDAVNPQTKQKIVVPAHHQVRFRISKDFKEQFANDFKETADELVEVEEQVVVPQEDTSLVEAQNAENAKLEAEKEALAKLEAENAEKARLAAIPKATEQVAIPIVQTAQKATKKKAITKTKTDFIEMIHDTTGISKNKASKFLKAFASVIKDTLVVREDVVLKEIGTFTSIEMPAKDAVNPQTKQKIVVPAHHQVRFRVSKDFKAQFDRLPEEKVMDVPVQETPEPVISKPVIEPVIEVVEKAVIVPKVAETPKVKKIKGKVVTKTKADFIEIIVNESGISKNKANKFLKQFANVIKDELTDRGDVVLDDFGTFTTIEMPAKDAVNPQTKQKIVVPAHHQVRFRVTDSFKNKFNK